MESLIEELQSKLSNDEKRFQSMQENIEKFQKDYKEIKINELKSLIDKNDNDLKEKDINISGYKINKK